MPGRNSFKPIFKDFSGGLMLYGDTDFTPVILNRNQLLKCQNAYWRNGLQIRKGMIKLTANTISGSDSIIAMHRFYRAGTPPKLLASAGGIIAELDDGAGTWTNLKTGMAGDRVSMISYGPTEKVFIADGISTPQQWDGTTMSDYSTAPINTKQFLIHRDRIFAYQEGLDIAFSDNLDPDTWSAAPITLASSDPTINFMIKHSQSISDDSVVSQLLLFTANNVWILVGVDFQNLTDVYLHEVDGDIGTVSPKTVIRTPKGIVFLGKEKGRNDIFIISGGELGTKVTPIGFAIRQELEKIPNSALDEAVAVYVDGYYRLSVRPSGGIQNTKELWLKIDDPGANFAWFGPMVRSVGLRSMVVLSGFGDNNQLWSGGENGVVYWLDKEFNDDGTNIDVDIQTGFHDFDFPTQEKNIDNVFTNIQASGGTATIAINKDFQLQGDENSDTLSLTTVGGSFPYDFPFDFSRVVTNMKALNFLDSKLKGVYFSLRLTFSETNENFLLNTIGLSFNVDENDIREGD